MKPQTIVYEKQKNSRVRKVDAKSSSRVEDPVPILDLSQISENFTLQKKVGKSKSRNSNAKKSFTPNVYGVKENNWTQFD